MNVASPAGRWFWACAVVAIVAPAVVVLAIWLPAMLETGREMPLTPASRGGKTDERLPVYQRIYNAFSPLTRFDVLSARDAAAIADDEFVLGVEIGGEARAYPLNMLDQPGREVVNDTLGGEPVAATFCGLCNSPLAFSRQIDGRTLTFYVTGFLVDSNMLIKDVETRSGWIQLLGEAVDGPLKGKELEPVTSVWTDWKSWRTEHPTTTAVSFPRGTKRYARSALEADASRKRSFIDGLQWGLARDGQARSWPFSNLTRVPVVNDAFAGSPLLVLFNPATLGATAFDRRIDGKELVFRRRGDDVVDDQTGSVWDPLTGRSLRGPLEGRQLAPVNGVASLRDVWRDFHPQSSIWSPDEATAPAIEAR
jgi:Protein of unknown function (DUF3179)